MAASTPNQALSALLFLYRDVLHRDLDGPTDTLCASEARRLPEARGEIPRVGTPVCARNDRLRGGLERRVGQVRFGANSTRWSSGAG